MNKTDKISKADLKVKIMNTNINMSNTNEIDKT